MAGRCGDCRERKKNIDSHLLESQQHSGNKRAQASQPRVSPTETSAGLVSRYRPKSLLRCILHRQTHLHNRSRNSLFAVTSKTAPPGLQGFTILRLPTTAVGRNSSFQRAGAHVPFLWCAILLHCCSLAPLTPAATSSVAMQLQAPSFTCNTHTPLCCLLGKN